MRGDEKILSEPRLARVLHLGRLKASQGAAEGAPLEGLPCSLPQGALTELSGPAGSGKTERLLGFLAQRPLARVAWIESRLTAFPSAFPAYGVALERVLFVEAGEQSLWASRQAIRSQLFPFVVLAGLASEGISELDLRRLQLDAERAQASVVLLSEQPCLEGHWPIALQAEMRSREHGLKLSKAPLRLPLQGGVQ